MDLEYAVIRIGPGVTGKVYYYDGTNDWPLSANKVDLQGLYATKMSPAEVKEVLGLD